MITRFIQTIILTITMFSVVSSVKSQDLESFEKRVTEFTLSNGLTFIVVENHEAPVVSLLTYADVGSVDEVKGITGLAHVFEHMAFKGTTSVGAKDLIKEYAAMKEVDEIYNELRSEYHQGSHANPERIKELQAIFEKSKKEARELAMSNEMDQAIERAGGTGLNATTSVDATRYYYSLPSNKIELFFALESSRFLDPVLREFYIERDVVMEERRMRTENSPIGRLVEEMLSTAYKAHPYGEPTVGHMSDLNSMTRQEAMDFFKKYYGPNNLTIVISGDADPEHVKKLAHKYFDRLPKRAPTEPVETIEPKQQVERRVVMNDKSQPALLMGYHKVDIKHDDDLVFNVMSDILGNGRTSRLFKTLVKGEKIATDVTSFTDFPGSKYPNMMVFYARPSKDHTADDCEQAINQAIDDIRNNYVSEQELARAKVRARVNLIRELDSNMGLALLMAYFHVLKGDWRELFHSINQINNVTPEDIKRVANKYLVTNNRTIASIVTMGSNPTER